MEIILKKKRGLWQKEQLLNSSICLNYMPLTSTKDDQRVYNKNKTEKKNATGTFNNLFLHGYNFRTDTHWLF